jgi:hypothetical protein
MDASLIKSLCEYYLTGKEYPTVRLVSKQFSSCANSSQLYFKAKIYYEIPKGMRGGEKRRRRRREVGK